MKLSKESLFFVGISVVALVGVVFMLSSQNPKPIEAKKDVPEDSFVLGASTAKVTLMEFGDFQCPACRQIEPTIKELMKSYDGKVKFVFRHFPLPAHKNALLASEASEAAGEQGKFWEYHDRLYAEQPNWSTADDARNKFESYAADLGLDMDKFKAAVNSNKFADKIQRDKGEGIALGIKGTPTFFLNGEQVVGSYGISNFKSQIDELLSQ